MISQEPSSWSVSSILSLEHFQKAGTQLCGDKPLRDTGRDTSYLLLVSVVIFSYKDLKVHEEIGVDPSLASVLFPFFRAKANLRLDVLQ